MEGRNRIVLWLILIAAIVSISSAGAVFQLMSDVDPMLRSSWRFQLTALFKKQARHIDYYIKD